MPNKESEESVLRLSPFLRGRVVGDGATLRAIVGWMWWRDGHVSWFDVHSHGRSMMRHYLSPRAYMQVQWALCLSMMRFWFKC
jgi:hypothetical protein